ncbi:MAG: SH3 domain-containing protein [Lachnospiraceae bacterium]|nr:SH3 domain-containing protein [Lachnospiraceae bacterium]
MKKPVRILSACAVLAAAFLLTPVTSRAETGTVTASSAYVRSSAGTDSVVVTKKTRGQTVEITGETNGTDGKKWYAVSWNGGSGYIRSDLVTKGKVNVTTTKTTTSSKSGTFVKGNWQNIPGRSDAWYYVNDNGDRLTNCFSTDGYYVDINGARFATKEILSAKIGQRNSWMTPGEAGGFDCFVPGATVIQKAFNKGIAGARVISVYSNHVMVRSVVKTNNQQTTEERLAIYKNTDINGYTIMVRTTLGGDRLALLDNTGSSVNPVPEYDYGALRFFTNMVSRSGDLLASAIYSSWEDNNEYGLEMGKWIRVGDTMVRYMPADGAGLYEIKAAF